MRIQTITRHFVTLIVAVGAGLTLIPGVAAADPVSRSFPDCPVLSEDNSTGPCVTRLQADLNAVNSGYGLAVDGTFGADTRIAVLDFQGRNHLGADGIVGPETADELARQAEHPAPDATSGGPQSAQSPTGGGDDGGIIDTGKSAQECFIERVKDKIPDEVVDQILDGHLPKSAVIEQLRKYLGTPLDVAKAVKCIFVG